MKIISDLIVRIALLVLVAPLVPITGEIAGLFDQVSERIEQVRTSV